MSKSELLEFESVGTFFHSFFHYPEAFYTSSADEQQIECEIRRKLSIEPFAVYASENVHTEISEQLSNLDNVGADFWQAHNLLPLLRILYQKRRIRKLVQEGRGSSLEKNTRRP